MKLIKSSFSILEQEPGLDGIYKQIELAGRTCYKSEDKITEDSAPRFVDMLISRGHTAMLEHGTIYLQIPGDSPNIDHYRFRYENNPYSRTNYVVDDFMGLPKFDNTCPLWVTTNYRVLQENGWLEDLKYLCEPTEHHAKRVTVRFNTDIGITREANRHRVNSMAEQSTRYCNYSKDRFNNEITVCLNTDISKFDADYIHDKWDMTGDMSDSEIFERMCYVIGVKKNADFTIFDNWLFANLACQWSYLNLIKLGWTPQQARRVLPLDLHSELIHTAFVDDWKHFFELRCAIDAHPDMRALAIPLKEEFIKRGYINEESN